jgi:hypothetical protein
MGAVYHWHVDWDGLSSAGFYETLTAERGIFEMDEYVLDTIGIGNGSEEANELLQFLRQLSYQCFDYLTETNTPASMDAFVSCAKAMFLFGMVFEMNRLGMK